MFRKTWVAGLALLGTLWMGGLAQAQGVYDVPGSEKVTNLTVVRIVGSTVASTLSTHLESVGGVFGFSPGASNTSVSRADYVGQTGKSAGMMNPHGFGLWVNGGYTSIDFNGTMGGLPAGFDGHVLTGMMGVDYRLSDVVTFGVAGGYENTDLDTQFNTGTLETDGYSVLPYVVVRLGQHFSVNASGGYSWLNTDMTRTSGAVTGTYDSTRWTGAVNLLSNWSAGKWRFGTLLGYLYIHQDDDAYVESTGASVAGATTKIGQGRVGGLIGYDLGKVETYFTGRYEYDFTSEGPALPAGTPTTGRSGFRLGLGMRFALAPNVSGNLEGTTVQGRDNLDEYGVNGTLRFMF